MLRVVNNLLIFRGLLGAQVTRPVEVRLQLTVHLVCALYLVETAEFLINFCQVKGAWC